MPVGCTVGPKSVARTMGTASLCHGTIASADQPPVVKRYCASLSGAISSTRALPLPFFP